MSEAARSSVLSPCRAQPRFDPRRLAARAAAARPRVGNPPRQRRASRL